MTENIIRVALFMHGLFGTNPVFFFYPMIHWINNNKYILTAVIIK